MAFVLTPAEGRNFINREELIEELTETLKNPRIRMGFALYGKRRVGKTSVLKELERRLASEKRIVVVYINIWDLGEETVAELAEVLTREVLAAYRNRLGLKYAASELLRLPVDILRKALGEINLGIRISEQIELLVKLKKEEKTNSVSALDGAFSLAEEFAKETDTECLILIDEFPSIMELKKNGSAAGEGIIRKLRSIYEKSKRITLGISGSIKATMEAVALSSSSAFYGQLIIREVLPLKKKYVGELLSKNLSHPIDGEGVDAVYAFTAGIPLYVHILGRRLEALGKPIGKKQVEREISGFVKEEGALLFKRKFRNLSTGERKVILAMAVDGLDGLGEIAKKTGSTSATISTHMRYLREKGIVNKKERGVFEIDDPVFGMWIAESYL